MASQRCRKRKQTESESQSEDSSSDQESENESSDDDSDEDEDESDTENDDSESEQKAEAQKRKPKDDTNKSKKEAISKDWSSKKTSLQVNPFTRIEGVCNPPPASATLLDYFQICFPSDIIYLLVEQMNLYRNQPKVPRKPRKMKQRSDTTKARPQKENYWQEVTPDIFRAFIGVNIYMGINILPTIHDYYDSSLGFKPVNSVFSQHYLDLLFASLHANDNSQNKEKDDPKYDKLFKLRPLIQALQKSFAKAFKPGRFVTVDEGMVAFEGRCSFKQFMMNKPIKRGFKIWMLCDSATGYVLDFQIYTGKNGTTVEKDLGKRVVMDLTQSLAGHNHVVLCDNFFTSVSLFRELLDKHIYAVGTVRSGSSGFPKPLMLSTKKGGLNMARGENKFYQNGNLVATAWQDKNKVLFLSTACDPVGDGSTTVTRRIKTGKKWKKEIITCPPVALMYNANMHGVDRFDQMISYYEIGQRAWKKWYPRIFYRLIDFAILNSFILYTKSPNQPSKKLSFLEYKIQLAELLIGSRTWRKTSVLKVNALHPNGRYNGRHFPDRQVPHVRRQCEICDARPTTQCTDCQVQLCSVGCFQEYHTR